MKIYKRITGMFLVLFAAMLFAAEAMAAGSIDTGRGCTMSVSYRDGDTPIAGAAFSVYRVAAVSESGALSVDEDFSRFGVDIQGEEESLAATLEGYVLQGGLTPVSQGKTDAKGFLTFPAGDEILEPGLYLVLGSRHRQGGAVYDAQPFMVMLPTEDKESGGWLYDVAVNIKFSKKEEPGAGTVTRKVLKVWKDAGNEKKRPKEIVVHLLRDGETYDTVTLNATNNWRHTWDNLDNASRWLVVEDVPSGYTVQITREGITFVVTNTGGKPGNPPHNPGSPGGPSGGGDSDTPGTPDHSGTTDTPGEPDAPEMVEIFDDLVPLGSLLPQTGQLWWPVPLLLCVGLLFTVTGIACRKGVVCRKGTACHKGDRNDI